MDTLQQKIDWWMMVVSSGGPIHNDVYAYTFKESFGLYRRATDPKIRELVKPLLDRQNIPLRKAEKLSVNNFLKYMIFPYPLYIECYRKLFIIRHF